MKDALFQDLGIGVGLRPDHYDLFLNEKPRTVSWVEVISENYMAWEKGNADRPAQILGKIRQDYPVVLHGVSLSIGSTDALSLSYLKRLKSLVDRIQPAWVSDHLCWTGVNGENLHDLLPIPYTGEALGLVVEKIQRVQEFLGRRILIENPSSYVSFSQSEMTEWEFIAQFAEKSDCGLLLDLNNVFVSSVNHGFDPLDYLRAIPVRRVAQIHLAGHSKQGGLLIDTHDAPVSEEVWSLYRWAAQRFGPVSAMIERDGNIPAWEILEAEVGRIRSTQHEKWSGGDFVTRVAGSIQASRSGESPDRFESSRRAWRFRGISR